MKTNHLALILLAALAATTYGGDAKVTIDSSNGSSAFLVRDSASNELARVSSDGKVGIGTTSPSVALDVNGSFKASGMPTIICPITTVTAGNNFPFGASATKTGNISSDASSITIGETGLYLITFTLGFNDLSHGWITVNEIGRLVSWAIIDPANFTTTTVAPLNSGDVNSIIPLLRNIQY